MAENNFKLIWKPEGGSPREWAFNMAKPPWDVRVQTEKATDWPWVEFQNRLDGGSGLAMQALLWILRKRDEPKLAMSSVIPDFDELEYEMQCPACKTWVSTQDDEEHVCPVPEDDDEPEEATPGEAKRSSRKSSDTAPGSSTS